MDFCLLVVLISDVDPGNQSTVKRILIRPDWAGNSTLKRTRHTADRISAS